MKKVIAYVLSIAGLVLLGVGTFSKNVGIEEIKGLSRGIITIIGVVLIVVGVIFLKFFGDARKTKEEQIAHEVPIYKGDEIVGYRRKNSRR